MYEYKIIGAGYKYKKKHSCCGYIYHAQILADGGMYKTLAAGCIYKILADGSIYNIIADA